MNEGVEDVCAQEGVNVGGQEASAAETVLRPAGEVTHPHLFLRHCRRHRCEVKKEFKNDGGGDAA